MNGFVLMTTFGSTDPDLEFIGFDELAAEQKFRAKQREILEADGAEPLSDDMLDELWEVYMENTDHEKAWLMEVDVPEPPKSADPRNNLYIDDDGYVCFTDTKNLEDPGILWVLHSIGWEAYINDSDELEPLVTLAMQGVVPNDDMLGYAAEQYEERRPR